MTKYRLSRIVGLLCIVSAIAGCSKDISLSFSDDGDMKAGDPVMFTTYVSGRAGTRYADENAFNEEMGTYEPASAKYSFTYYMYEKNGETDSTEVTLGPQIYWPDITTAYGFKAIAGSEAVSEDQDSEDDFWAQDRLLGFGFEPTWNESESAPTDQEGKVNYRTGVEWKEANIARSVPTADQKKIPLYLKHQRARITIILKAGFGVLRSTLATASNITMKIYSYKGETPTRTDITPYPSSTTVNYEASDYGGAATDVETTQFTAIVEPFDYRTGEGKNIAQITVGGRTFTYKPSNDTSGTGDYDLTAGKHLTITITLSPGAAMSASVTNWTESSTDATLEPDSN